MLDYKVVNLPMLGMGTDVPYTVPDDVSSLSLRPMGGNVYVYNDASDISADFPLLDTEALPVETRGLPGTVLHFRGGATVVLKIWYFTGIL